MIQKEEKKIEGMNVIVVQWNARKAFKNKFYFARTLKPVLGKIGAAIASLPKGVDAKTMTILDIDTNILADAIGTLGETMGDDEFDTFYTKVFSSTWFNNEEFKPENFDHIFNNNMMCFYKTVFFVLEVNYKGLFLANKSTGKPQKEGKTATQKRQQKGSQKN